MSSYVKLGIAIVLLLGGLGYVFWSGLSQTKVMYRNVQGVQGRPSTERVRVAGRVEKGSVSREGAERTLKFRVLDESGSLPVRFAGTVPDMFQEDREVIVEGRIGGDGVFEADNLLTKCPSKYEGMPASGHPADQAVPRQDAPGGPGAPAPAPPVQGT